MKETIKKTLRKLSLKENVLMNEVAMNISNLDSSVVIVDINNSFTVYDTNYLETDNPEDGVVGFIALNTNKNILSVDLSMAKKGYGPFIYELAMQMVYPSPLMPQYDGDVNEKALRIWDYFYKGNSPDVKVVEFKEGDEGYRETLGYHSKESMVYFNSRFYMQPTDLYYLETNSEDYFDDMDSDDANEIRKMITHFGNSIFDKMY